VVRQLATLPEKKALVYITGGISKSGSLENQAQLEASINAAVKSNVAIYPIDARGLMADPPGGAASTASSRGGEPVHVQQSSAPPSTTRRKRSSPWRPIPAARHSSTATTSRSA
jgi:hypothetical protein